ncbi:MAG: aminopeptidase P family protein [Clostridia bacterium]|nr:aminopeptidase P family protein [Clostridia bacterium]
MNDRIQRLRAAMERDGTDAVLLNSLTAIRYITGFTSDESVVAVTKTRCILVTDFRYTIQAKEQCGDRAEVLEAFGSKALELVWDVLQAEDVQTVGFEEDIVTVSLFRKYEASGFSFVPFAEQLNTLRLIKSADEIASLQKAQALADQTFTELLKVIHSGMTEKEVAAELAYIGAKLGSEGVSFETIVGSGPNGAMCHAIPGERKLQQGDLVVLDFGCLYNGYHSDMTRTFAVGKPDAFSEQIYNIVRTAQQRALDALRPGITGKQLDAIARDYIAEQGYGECFGHSLGHGFGLLIHESPRASATCDTVFEPGMTITVEPGIYIEGKLGVRIEDCCVVTENGYHDFCTSTKDLQVID